MSLDTNPGFREGTVETRDLPRGAEAVTVLRDLQGTLGVEGARLTIERHVGATLPELLKNCETIRLPAPGCQDWLTYR